jgi:ABC-type multidrug transport system ATPase subunit
MFKIILTGSGKTTLLDILCNRILASKRTGTILFNGKETNGLNSFAYVPQQDLLLNTATVRETLETAARLRLSNIKTKDLNERIEIVLNDLGLKVYYSIVVLIIIN